MTSVSYKEFGAKGDGRTDDMAAIVKAHEHANTHGLPVKAEDGATYYISGNDLTAVIKTDTDFGKATFIIDDRNLENYRKPVFNVPSDLKAVPLKGISRLTKGQKKLNVTFDETCIVEAYNDDVKLYKRFGKNQNNGSSQRDFFLVDTDGNIDPRTPIIWTFDTLSELSARPVEDDQLTISGGRFITYPPDKVDTQYHSRGIDVGRSNVVIKGLRHDVEKEGKDGPPYRGFISVSKAANVTIQDTVFTGRRTYWKKANTEGDVPMGSYDLSLNSSLNVTLTNCSQTNDIQDRNYWGIMGTNFCKNITLENCTLSRFDAHQGVTNATIRKCRIGYMGIKAIGHGLFTIEDTTVRGRSFVDFRQDYGSTWNGDFIIKNCRLIVGGGNKNTSVSIFSGHNPETHEFGYVCHMPGKVEIENFIIDDSKGDIGGAFIFSDFNPAHKNSEYKPKFPLVVTKAITLKNVSIDSGKPLKLSRNPYMLKDVMVTSLDGLQLK